MSTLGEMADAVQDATLRGGENRTQIIADLQQAIWEVDALLRPTVATVSKGLTAGQGDYSLTTDWALFDVQSVRDVIYSGTSIDQVWPLAPASPQDVRDLRQQDVTATTVNLWAFDDIDTFMIYPITQSVGDTVSITYVKRAVALADESSVPTGLPVDFHDIYVIAGIRRSMRQQSPEYTQMYHAYWNTRLDEYRRWRNRRDGAMPRRARVRGWGRRTYHDNSVDYRR